MIIIFLDLKKNVLKIGKKLPHPIILSFAVIYESSIKKEFYLIEFTAI